MIDKALWIREYKSARWILWLMPIAHFLALGLQRMNRWLFAPESELARDLARLPQWLHGPYDDGSLEMGARLLLTLAALALALIQLGGERRNGTQELLFSLPYSRRRLFAAKWLVGVTGIAGATAFGTGIDMIVVAASPIAPYFDLGYHAAQFVYSTLAVSAAYSLALFLGSITGSVASQAALSLLMWLLPGGILFLLHAFLAMHGVADQHFEHYWYMEGFLFFITYMVLPFDEFHPLRYGVLAILLLAGTAFGAAAYERNRTENNGKLMLFPVWERTLQVGFVTCFALLCALVGSLLLRIGTPLVSYYIGGIAGLLIGWRLIVRLTRMRLKI